MGQNKQAQNVLFPVSLNVLLAWARRQKVLKQKRGGAEHSHTT